MYSAVARKNTQKRSTSDRTTIIEKELYTHTETYNGTEYVVVVKDNGNSKDNAFEKLKRLIIKDSLERVYSKGETE